MKTIAGLAVIAMLTLGGVALAQDKGGGDKGGVQAATDTGDNTTYKAKTVYDFEDDMVWDPLESTCRHASLSIL